MLCDVRSRIIGRKQELFCFPAYQDEAQIYHIRRDTTGHLADIHQMFTQKKKKIQQTKRSKSLQATQKSALTILISSRCAFPKLSDFRAKVPARPRFCADRSGPRELCGRGGGHSGRAAPSSSSSSAAAAAASGPAAPGGPSRVTHGHGAVGGG